jgi:TetR/AcrR family transcriptional repressor of mexJK operon
MAIVSASLRSFARNGADDTTRLRQVINAAEIIFLAKGYHAATMSDVAKQAGMSKKTIYTIIESKADLFVALLNHHQAKLIYPAPSPGAGAHEALTETMLCLAQFLLSAEQIALVRLIMAEYTHSPDLGRFFMRTKVHRAKLQLETWLAEMMITRGCRFEPKEMAAMLFGMAMGEFHLSVLVGYRAAPSKPVLEKRVRQAVEIFLRGCGVEQEQDADRSRDTAQTIPESSAPAG